MSLPFPAACHCHDPCQQCDISMGSLLSAMTALMSSVYISKEEAVIWAWIFNVFPLPQTSQGAEVPLIPPFFLDLKILQSRAHLFLPSKLVLATQTAKS